MGAKTKPVYTEIIDGNAYSRGNGEELIPTVFRSNFIVDNAEVVDECFRVAAALRPEVHQLLLGNGSFVRDVLCLNEREFKDIVTEAVFSGKPTFRFNPEYRLYGVGIEKGCMRIYVACNEPISPDIKPVVINRNSIYAQAVRKKSARELHPDVLSILCNGLMEEHKSGKIYLAEETPEWLGLISNSAADVDLILDELRMILFSPMKQVLKNFGVTQKELSESLMISRRTVEDWCEDKAPVKPYIRLLIAQHFWLYQGA